MRSILIRKLKREVEGQWYNDWLAGIKHEFPPECCQGGREGGKRKEGGKEQDNFLGAHRESMLLKGSNYVQGLFCCCFFVVLSVSIWESRMYGNTSRLWYVVIFTQEILDQRLLTISWPIRMKCFSEHSLYNANNPVNHRVRLCITRLTCVSL